MNGWHDREQSTKDDILKMREVLGLSPKREKPKADGTQETFNAREFILLMEYFDIMEKVPEDRLIKTCTEFYRANKAVLESPKGVDFIFDMVEKVI